MDLILLVELAALGVLALLTVAVTARARRARAAEQPRSAGTGHGSHTLPIDSAVAQASAVAVAAEGTREDWDRHVRPVLAREFAEISGTARSSRTSGVVDDAAGNLLFGPELWRFVDPCQPFQDNLHLRGPGRRALAAIVRELEDAS